MYRSLIPTIVLLLACTVCKAQTTLLSLANPGAGSVNLSSTTFSTFRAEFRIENISSNASTRYIWGVGAFPNYSCNIPANTLMLFCRFGGDGTPNGETTADLAGRTDVRVRWQRDYTNLTYKLEIWNGDCTGYFSLARSISSAQAPLAYSGLLRVGDLMQLGFLRMYSSLDNNQGCPIDAPGVTGDLLDFRFETLAGVGTLNDVSGHSYTLSASGSSFVSSTLYPPKAVITVVSNPKRVFRATQLFTLNGADSATFSANGIPVSFFWTQISGPAHSYFSSRTATSTTIAAPVSGQYTYRLTVKDAVGTAGFADLVVGVMATDLNSVVILPDTDFGWVQGNVLMHGASQWPWYEVTEAADVDLLSPLMSAPPVSTLQAGTIIAPTGSPNQISQGLITASVNSGVTLIGIGTDFTQALVGTRLVIHWDPDGDGSYQGRKVTFVNQVIDSTTLVTNDYYFPGPPASFSTTPLAWGTAGADYGPYNAADPNSFILNFYEAGLAVSRLYAKTGLTAYKTQFHSFCDNWWRWALDSGYGSVIPRNSGLHFMLACGADPTYNVPPGLWDGVARITKAMSGSVLTTAGNQVAYSPTNPVIAGSPDVREYSYVLRPTAILARLYGKHGGSTSTWCTYLQNQVTNMWIATAAIPSDSPSSSYAFWQENLFVTNVTYLAASHPAGDINGIFGTSPWRSAGLPNIALTYAREALADVTACNNPVLADQLFNPLDVSGLIVNSANFAWDYGRSSDGGVFYANLYETDTGNRLGDTVFNDFPPNGPINVVNGSTAVVASSTYFTAQFGPCDGTTQIQIRTTNYNVAACADDTHLTLAAPYAGASENGLGEYRNTATIAVTNGSTAVVGTGTKFTVLYAPCDGTTYISVVGNIASQTDRRVYQVASCVDDTNLILNVPYAGPTESGLRIFGRARRANQNCGPASLVAYCEPDRFNGRNLAADIAAGAAWIYAQTALESWKARAQYYANKTFGGAAGGSGSLGNPTGSLVYSRPGTISVTNGSTAVVGNGTQFTAQFGSCNGTAVKIVVADTTATWAAPPQLAAVFNDYSVTACPDNTHLTLSEPYAGATRSGISMFYNPDDPQWQGADGGIGNLGEILPLCQSSAPPCGEGFLVPKYGKPLGMASGAGNTPVMLGDLQGGLAPLVNRTITSSFNLSAVPNATQARLILTKPDGSTQQATCSVSPCSLIADVRQGAHLLQIAYLSSTGTVLALGEQTRVRVEP